MDIQERQILVVDDDPGHCDLLSRYLGNEGYSVATVNDGAEMDRFLERQTPDLIILDLMLPGEDGLTIARRLHTQGDTAIIMLSARGEEVDRIVGLEIGADDYLPKPFNPRELLARIKAVLRRRETGPKGTGNGTPHQIHNFGDFALDITTHQLNKGGEDVPLTSSEFGLLKAFVEHPDRVLSRDRLVDLLKGYDRMPFDRSIDVRVTRLRRKIEKDPANPRFIITIWGEGYLFSPKGKTASA